MRVGTTRDEGNDLGYAEFGGFLDRPLETIELEDGDKQFEFAELRRKNFFAECELDAVVIDADDFPPANNAVSRDLKLLADTRTQYAREMRGILAGQERGVGTEFVGEESASHGFIINAGVKQKRGQWRPRWN